MSAESAPSSGGITDDVYKQARATYDPFVVELKTLIGEERNDELGRQTVKPSQMIEQFWEYKQFCRNIQMMMRGPIRNEAGEIIALNSDSDGKTITEEQWAKESADFTWQTQKEYSRLVDLFNNTNATLKTLAEKHGYKVTQVYEEFNRRGAVVQKLE